MAIRFGSVRLWAAIGLLTGSVACSDDDSGSGTKTVSTEGSLYAVMYEVFGETDSDSYLSVFDSLDLEEIDTANSREFAGGRAFLQTYNNWVFVGEPQAPTILRFVVDKEGKLEQEDELSLANYGLSGASIDDWAVNFISPTKAYYFESESGTTIIWDPSTMEITGEIAAPEGYLREDLTTNSSPAAVRGKRLFRAIYWEDDDANRSRDQHLLVYDTENDELVDSVEETRCPAPGNRAFVAEDGTIYFSNWIWAIADTLLKDGPKNCVLRVAPDAERYDPEWSLEFAELAEGREGAMFTYVADGKGLASIFHDEDVPHDENTDPWDFAGQPNWEIWNVDLAKRSGSPLEGVPLSAGAYTPIKLDGRLFLMVPDAGWDGTQLYEVADNRAEPYVKVPGWSYMFQKIR